MKTLYDAPFHWMNTANGTTSKCDLVIYETMDRKVIMVSERDDNPGMSVTNASEILFDEIFRRHAREFDLDESAFLVERGMEDPAGNTLFHAVRHFDNATDDRWRSLTDGEARIIAARFPGAPAQKEGV